MADLIPFGSISNRLRFTLKNSSTGVGLTGLTFSSTGLIISTIADNEATATAYTVAGSTIETITTLGTFATPTATKCRFKEVDATNHPGLYEFQFANARFAVANSKRLIVSVSGATSLLGADYQINLQAFIDAADTLLDRDMALGTDSGTNSGSVGRTVRQAFRVLRNKITTAAGVLTVFKEDDSTLTWTAVETMDSSALPITGIDPT